MKGRDAMKAKMDKRFYIAVHGILAEECARKLAKQLRRRGLKITTAAIPTSRLGNTVFFRDYWIDVEINRLRDLIWVATIGSWLTGEYKDICDIYGYRSVEYGESMKECWKKVYSEK
jgi:hypothetical protein